MARASTTSDAFNAVAEPQRRQILGLLIRGESSVGDIARSLRMEQPQASKHLKVLRKVGLVHVRESGKQRLYQLNAEGLKPIHDWTEGFKHLWEERMDRLESYLGQLQQKEKTDE